MNNYFKYSYRWFRVNIVPKVSAPYDYLTGFIAGIKDSKISSK